MSISKHLGGGWPGVACGLVLLSLVFLGSPGCGCGDDDLGGGPDRCCCQFEWIPGTNLFDVDVRLVIENADATLAPSVNPALLTGVSGGAVQLFRICVNENHVLLDSFELAFVDDDTNVEYGRVRLTYRVRCEPDIQVLSGGIELVSIDCGTPPPQQCCCEFEWLPGPNQVGDVTINAENVSAGLNPVITPNALTGVGPDAVEIFDVCVDDDHPLGAQFDLVIRQQGSGAVLGTVQLVYDEQCIPTVVPVSAAPTLNISSTECGGDPVLCCCEFDWLPGPNDSGDVSLTTANVSPGLTVQITPSTLTGVSPRVFQSFTVCINADHNLLDSFDLVITRTSDSQEFGRARIVYRLRCEPNIGDVPDATSLALQSTDCGGDPLQCCCTLQLTTDPEFWSTPNITLSLESVGATLVPATISPTTFTGLGTNESFQFDVCVNPAHDVDETMEIVITETGTTNVVTRVPLTYDPECVAVPGQDSGGVVSAQNLGCDVLGPVGKPR